MRRLLFVFACFAAATPLRAQEASAPPAAFDLSGSIVAMSDYRFRGVSRSDEDPALQGNLTLSHTSGLYTGVTATTLRTGGGPDFGDGEFDLYAGWRGELGRGFDLDAGLTYYAFAGASGHADLAEPYASIGYLIGPAQFAAGARYAPSQRGTGDEDRLYLFGQASVDLPGRPIAFTAEAGRQEWGRFGSYWNWSLGARYRIAIARRTAAEIGLRYVDTDLPSTRGQDAGLLLSAALRF